MFPGGIETSGINWVIHFQHINLFIPLLTLRISCNPASIYFFKVNNGNNGTVSEILTIKTPNEVFLLLTTSRFRTLCTFLLFL